MWPELLVWRALAVRGKICFLKSLLKAKGRDSRYLDCTSQLPLSAQLQQLIPKYGVPLLVLLTASWINRHVNSLSTQPRPEGRPRKAPVLRTRAWVPGCQGTLRSLGQELTFILAINQMLREPPEQERGREGHSSSRNYLSAIVDNDQFSAGAGV